MKNKYIIFCDFDVSNNTKNKYKGKVLSEYNENGNTVYIVDVENSTEVWHIRPNSILKVGNDGKYSVSLENEKLTKFNFYRRLLKFRKRK